MKKFVVVLLIVFFSTELTIGQSSAQGEKSAVIQSSRLGLMNSTEMNVGFGLGNTNADYAKKFLGLTSIFGYGMTKKLQCGVGAGLSFYNGGILVPIFFDLRYDINFGKISAYAFGDGGLLFGFSNTDNGNKFLLNPGVGVKYPLGNNLSANLGAGLFMQTTKEKERDSFVNFKMGITYTFRK